MSAFPANTARALRVALWRSREPGERMMQHDISSYFDIAHIEQDSPGQFSYDYYLKDHLGSTRMVNEQDQAPTTITHLFTS